MGFEAEESKSKFPPEAKSPRTQERMSKIQLSDIKIDNTVDDKFFKEFYHSLMFQTFLEEFNKPGQQEGENRDTDESILLVD